jgi:hypothetical protein
LLFALIPVIIQLETALAELCLCKLAVSKTDVKYAEGNGTVINESTASTEDFFEAIIGKFISC